MKLLIRYLLFSPLLNPEIHYLGFIRIAQAGEGIRIGHINERLRLSVAPAASAESR